MLNIDEILPEIEDIIKVAILNHSRPCCIDNDVLQARSMHILQEMNMEITSKNFLEIFHLF